MVIPTSDVPQNLASQMTHWAQLIIFPSAGIMALPALFNRDFKHVFAISAIAGVISAFVFDAHGVQTFFTGLSHSVFSS
jgi:hypothetical protein